MAHKVKVKKKPLDENTLLESSPEIIQVEDDEDKQEQVSRKESPKMKNLQVSIETLKLKPVMPVIMNNPQTVRRGRGFHLGAVGLTGKTSNNNDAQ